MAENKFQLVVIPERCKECGICIEFCPRKILAASENGVPVLTDPESCSGCRQCEYYCPDFAIRIKADNGSGREKKGDRGSP